MLSLLLGLSLSLSPLWPSGGLPSQAVEMEAVANPREANNGWVTDQANLLSDDAEAQLNALLTQLEATNGAEMAVVTVLDTQPSASPKAFATELFNHWKLGKVGLDNGILFLVSIGDRRNEIETGYGIEGILPDAKLGQILQEQVTPQFKQGNFEAGILAATQTLAALLEKETFEPLTPLEQTQQQLQTLLHPFGWSVAGMALISGGIAWIGIHGELGPQKIAPVERSTHQASVNQDWIDAFHRIIGPSLAGRKGLNPAAKVPHLPLNSERLAVFFVVLFTSLASLFLASWFTPAPWFTVGGAIFVPELLLVWTWLAVETWKCCALERDRLAQRTFKTVCKASWEVLGLSLLCGLLVYGLTVLALGLCHWLGFWEDIALWHLAALVSFLLLLPWVMAGLSSWAASLRYLRLMRDGDRLLCQTCETPMGLLGTAALEQQLRQPEKVARDLKSATYEGWQCPICSTAEQGSGFNTHLFSWAVDGTAYSECPTCEALTMTTKTEITKAATTEAPGEKLTTQTCACCDLVTSKTKEIPQLPEPSSRTSSSASWGGSSGGSSSSSGSSSGGSFGGGSSGGGGAGSSW